MSFFVDESGHRAIVCSGLYAIAINIEEGACSADAVRFSGGIRCWGQFEPSRPRILNKFLSVFLKLIPIYYMLFPEWFYVSRRDSHERFLHTVANTVLCAFYLKSPSLIRFKDHSSTELDTTVLPRWIQRIILKVTVKPDYSLVCTYQRYSRILLED
jgi:hypothetical protein